MKDCVVKYAYGYYHWATPSFYGIRNNITDFCLFDRENLTYNTEYSNIINNFSTSGDISLPKYSGLPYCN